jgi:hypothetical protein
MTYNTYMENLPLTTYTSPLTGTEYLVVPKTLTRAVGGFLYGTPLRQEEYTQYDIVLNGNPVQFCFSEGDVPATVAHLENPGPDFGSRYD